MPYDDDDLFGEEFDFVDDDDDDDEVAESRGKKDADEDEPAPKSRRRTPARDKAEKPEKPPAERAPRGRAKPPAAGRRNSRPPVEEPPAADVEEPLQDDAPLDEEVAQEEPTPEPVGPPADHVVHIYEYGKLKRTIPRKFTDEEAVSFAEEYTRTGKAYGRYAVATPEDEEPAPTFAGASRGS
jgi:hypothetical protein